LRGEHPSRDGPSSNQIEGIRGDVRGFHALRGAVAIGERYGASGVRGKARKPAGRAEFFEVRIGKREIRTAIVDSRNVQHAIRIVDRKFPERVSVDHREHHVVHADSESQEQYRRRRAPQILCEAPRGMPRLMR
jgi:hypothetical protein